MTMKTNEILQFVQDNDTFLITYYAKKHSKIITRKGTWTEKCKYFTSKVGNHMMTYFDMDAQGYRTAKGSWTVRY